MFDNEVLQKQVEASEKKPLNTIGLSIPIAFAKSSGVLNWNTVLLALDNLYLNLPSVTDYALDVLDESSSEEVFSLVMLDDCEKEDPAFVRPLLCSLAAKESPIDTGTAKERLLYIVLKWVYENIDTFEAPWEMVDYICDDFDFPESTKGLPSWIPIDNYDYQDGRAPFDLMKQRWNDYLLKEHARLLALPLQ